MYGAWITPSGEVIRIEEKLTHTRYCDYRTANDEGWIGIVDQGGCSYWSDDKDGWATRGMCLRFNPANATKEAMRKAVAMIRSSKETEFYLSDAFTGDFKGHRRHKTKAESIEFMQQLYRGELELKNRHGKPFRKYEGTDYYG